MKEDVSSTVEYFDGDVMAATVWEKKYALRDENSEAIEHTPTDMHHRMAKYFADVEAKYDIVEGGAIDKSKVSKYGQERKPLTEEEIFKLFDHFKYVVPGGSVMSGLGSALPVSLSNCWVIDSLNDSIEGIFNTCNEMSQLFKRRGGVGFDISKLRPSGAKVNNSAKYSTGAVSFMDLFSTVTTTIAQCIEENQQLLTRRGLVKIKDINIGDEVWTRKGFIKVINKYDKGIQPLVSLKTKNHSELLATSDHVLMSASEGIGPVNKKISELAIGDPIAMLHGNNTITEYQELDYNYEKPIVKVTKDGTPLPHNRYEEIEIPRVLGEQLAYIIGYCHGDGYTYRGRDLSVSINNADTDIKDKLFEYRKNVFGHETHSTDKRSTYSVIHICGTEGCKLLEENDLDKPKTEFLRIPNKVWLSPHSVQMAYLSGLFDADGYASGSKKGYSFCTINLDFAKDIRKMLLMNGIFSVIHCEDPHKENWHVKYYVNVIGTYNQKGFVDKLNESVKIQRKRFVSKTDHIKSPFIVGNEGIKKTPWIPYKHLITNESLDRIDNYNDSMLSLDYVESISECGEGHVYDIELESENMFWCEGFYVHNCGRRGAVMLSIHIDHPDAKEFIEKKQDLTKVTGANISVQIGDDFMNAVINDTDFYQTWPIDKKVNVDESAEYDTLVETTDEDGNKAYFKKIRAKELWNTLVHCAWNTAEPGILFKTKHYNYSPDGIYDRFRGTSTNPCGEIFMKEDSCRLVHVNFSSFIKDEYEENASIDSEKLYQVVYETIRLGDDLVDLEADAITRILKKIENDGDKEKGEYKMYSRLLENTLQGRRCGVGFFGLADALAKLGIKFDSDEGLAKIEALMDIFYKAQLDSEIDMAVTRGAFPAYSNELEKNATSEWYTYLAEHYPEQYERMMKYGRRNVSFGTCAPTGSVAMLARCSSGIEPIFMPFYTRRVKCTNDSDRVDFVDRDGEKFTEYVTAHPTLQKWAEKKMGDTSSWSPKEWQDAYEKSPWFGSTANDIDWSKRIEVQAIVQKRVSHSISSTVNLPNSTTEEEVSNIYIESWKRGLKGVTVYRDGCRSGVIVAVDKKEEPKKDTSMICMEDGTAKRRPKTLEAKIIRFNNKGDKWVGVIGMLDGKPYELFTGMLEKLNIPSWVETGVIIKNYEEIEVDGEIKKKSRYDLCYNDKDGYRVCVEGISRTFNPEFWNYAKLISGLLRHHMPIPYIIKVISTLKMDDSTINTWKNGVVRVLRKFESSVADEIEGEKCPECGGRLVRENGCIHCIDCGYSKCG